MNCIIYIVEKFVWLEIVDFVERFVEEADPL